MSAAWRAASPGVSSTKVHPATSGRRHEGAPARDADRTVADVLVAVATLAASELRVVRVDEPDPLEEGVGRELREELGHALGRVEAVAGREQVAGVEAEPHALAVRLLEQRGGFGDGGRDGAGGPRHQLDHDPSVLGVVLGGAERRRGARPGLRGVDPGAARAAVQDQEIDAHRVARADAGRGDLPGALAERRVGRGDVHHVGRVRGERSQARRAPGLAERRGGLLADRGPRPGTGVRDEDLRAVGPTCVALRDHPAGGLGPPADVGPEPHTM